MTQELSLFDALLSTGTKSSGETKVSKEGSSLFDDLLKSATTQNQNSGTPSNTVSSQNVSNSPQIPVVNQETTIKEGDAEIKSENTQPSSITKDISTATTNPTKVLNKASNLTEVEPSSPKNINTTTNVESISNPSILQNVDNNNTQSANNQIIAQPKVEVAQADTNISTQIKTKDNESIVAKTTSTKKELGDISSRTPSVLDKIQVDKNNKPKSDLESILASNQLEPKEKTSATASEIKIENELLGKGDTSTQKVQNSGTVIVPSSETLTTNGIADAEIETKPLQTTDMTKTQGVTSSVLSTTEQARPTDLFTSLTTQPITKSDKSSKTVISDNNQKADVANVVSQVLNDTNKTENLSITQNTADGIQEVVSVDTPKLKVTESQKQNIQSNLQPTDVSLVKESVAPNNDTTIVTNITQNTTVENKLVSQEIVMKNQDNVTKPVLQEGMGQNINVKADDVSLKVQESSLEKQPLDNLNIAVKPAIIKEETPQKVEPLNTKVVQTDTINAQDVKVNVPSDVPKTESTTNKQNAAVELAKLNQNETLKQVDVVIDDSLKDTSKKAEQLIPKQSNGLLDKLIEDTLKVNTKESSQVVDKLDIKNGQVLENVKTQDTIQKTDIMENIYKSSVSKNISLAAMQNATMAKETLKNGSSVQDIQKSADMLDLNLKSIEEVTTQESIKNDTKQQSVNIGRAFLEKDLVNKENLVDKDTKTFDMEHKQTSIVDTKTTSNNAVQKVVELTIGEAEVLTIQNRIIGARQQLSSMMSDVARAMYENYKPPHTAFRISLNPSNLGSIAILIRSQRADNSLSISMNMSNSSTLESVVANQNELRSALQKTFNDNSSFEFDFKLDPDASGSSFQGDGFNSNEQNQDTKEDEPDTFVASNDIIEEIQEVQKSGTYF